MSAHDLFEHEAETCKACLFNVNERDDFDADDSDSEACFAWVSFTTISSQDNFQPEDVFSSLFQISRPQSIRGPPVFS